MAYTTITEVNKESMLAALNSNADSMIVLTLESGSEIVLHKSVCHFARFKPATVIQLYYAVKVDSDEYHVVNSEYFSDAQSETAVEAFAIRHANGGYDISNISDPIESFLEAE